MNISLRPEMWEPNPRVPNFQKKDSISNAKMAEHLVCALPKKNNMYNRGTHFMRRHNRKGKQEDLPEQAPVIDVKAAEKATLGTKFYATGPSQPKKRSKIVMKRINVSI